MRIRQKALCVIIGGVILWGFMSCGPVAPPAFAQPAGLTAADVKRIGVVPFFKGRYGSGMIETLTCPVCRLYLEPDRVSPVADLVLTDTVHEALLKRHGPKVIPLAETKKAFEEIPRDDTSDSPLSIALKLGKTLKAEAMVLGTVWRFEDSDPASGRTASVAFSLFLIDVANEKVLWKEEFSETQKSLSENVLEVKSFLKKGVRWLSAGELAQYGIRETMKSYPF